MMVGSGLTFAHSTAGPWTWNWDPMVLAALALAGVWYVRGLLMLRRNVGFVPRADALRALSFLAGLGMLFIALISPLDALAHTLFSAHMVQHMVLILVAAPLLVYGAPFLLFFRAFPRRARLSLGRSWRRSGLLKGLLRAVTEPLAVWCLFTVTLWVWHLPGPYQAAVLNPLVHQLEHASFLFAAALSWWVILKPFGRRRRDYALALVLVFATKVQAGTLAALITFAPRPIYPVYTVPAESWGLRAMEDQQLAGLIMGTPMGLVYLFTGAALFLLWLRAMEERAHLGSRAVNREC